MKRSVFMGYAALEYAVELEGAFKADWTTLIRHRHKQPWPRPGGCHFYAAVPVARAGGAPALITWIGDDAMGTLYRTCCGEEGIGVQGVISIPGATPLCFLIYQPDGSCGCLFDFGMSGRVAITPEQERLIAAADLVCITVGPAAASMRALELIHPEATVAWITKNDPASFIPPLREMLARRAQFIFCNARERAWVDEVTGERPADQVIIQTGGAEAVQVHRSGSVTHLAVNALRMHDTTGAGDTLAGGALAAILHGETDIVRAVREGIDAAYELLSERRDA
jgi:ribokinase